MANETHVVVVGAGFGGNGVLYGLVKSKDSESSPSSLPPGMKVTWIDAKEDISIGGINQYVWTRRLDVLPKWPISSLQAAKHNGVTLLSGPQEGTIASIDATNKLVCMKNGKSIVYDTLVLSPGVVSDPSGIAGLADSSAIDICNADQIEMMKSQLDSIVEAAKQDIPQTVMILVARTPYKCPPVPFEYASLIDDVMRQHQVRDKVKILLAVPGGFPFAGPPAAQLFCSLLDEMNIEFCTHHFVTSVETASTTTTKATTVNFKVGEKQEATKSIKVDGLFCTFPQRAPDFCKALVNNKGFIEADLQTNKVPNLDGVYAIGDACHVVFPKPKKPHPKAGEFAHLMGMHVADQILSAHTNGAVPVPPSRQASCVAECGKDGTGVNVGPNFSEILATPETGMPKFLLDRVTGASNQKAEWVNGYLQKWFGTAVEPFLESRKKARTGVNNDGKHYDNGTLQSLYRVIEERSARTQMLREKLQKVRRKRSQLRACRLDIQDEQEQRLAMLPSTGSSARDTANTTRNVTIGVADNLLDDLSRDRQDALKSLQSILLRRKATAKFLQLSWNWNVTNDCFHIWHQGPVPTINGLRLGLSEAIGAPLVVGSDAVSTASANSRAIGANNSENSPAASPDDSPGSASQRGYWLWPGSSTSTSSSGSRDSEMVSAMESTVSSFYAGGQSANASNDREDVASHPPQPPPTRISWLEINSALGHVALLLSCLAGKNQSPRDSRTSSNGAVHFFPYEIYPMGSTSKIGLLRVAEQTTTASRYVSVFSSMTTSTPSANAQPESTTDVASSTTELVAVYNLFFSDESFSIFGRRNFNSALQCLLQCVQKAAETTVQRRDRTLTLPHPIAPLGGSGNSGTSAGTGNGTSAAAATPNGGELGIGGLSVAYGVADPVEWTHAMKFLLTNIKWLVAYSAKHVDQ